MNERLKELEKQSIITIETREISGAWDNDRPPYRYVTTTETKFSPEKFAELIVKEFATALTIAISVAGKENTRLLAGNGEYSGKLAVPVKQLEDILKHFGVEE